MDLYNNTSYQRGQLKVIQNIEKQITNNSLQFSTVEPVENFDADSRICFTSVHLPHKDLLDTIGNTITKPLKEIEPEHYYYSSESLHLTIKNIRVVNNPPHFNQQDIERAKKIFNETIPNHTHFQVYFYRLLLFPMSLALIGTTDPELDNIVLELDQKLKKGGVPDDKQYTNTQYFFSNMTLARFTHPISNSYKNKVHELSENIRIDPYTIGSVTLLTANAALKKKTIINTWQLQ